MTASVLQDWVLTLPIRQQGVLAIALRGPAATRKESEAKPIVRTLRACVMNSGRFGVPMILGEVFEGDNFMRMDYIASPKKWEIVVNDFYSSIDQYNIHYFMHLLHASVVLGFSHPIPIVATHWLDFYHKGVYKLPFKT